MTRLSAFTALGCGTISLFHSGKPSHKWNEWCFRPPLSTYRLNRARRTSSGLRDEWHDTALQTQGSKFEPWRSEAEHATSRSRRLSKILNLYKWVGNKIVFLWNLETEVALIPVAYLHSTFSDLKNIAILAYLLLYFVPSVYFLHLCCFIFLTSCTQTTHISILK